MCMYLHSNDSVHFPHTRPRPCPVRGRAGPALHAITEDEFPSFVVAESMLSIDLWQDGTDLGAGVGSAAAAVVMSHPFEGAARVAAHAWSEELAAADRRSSASS